MTTRLKIDFGIKKASGKTRIRVYMYKAYLSNDTQRIYPEKVTGSLIAVAFYMVRCTKIQLYELVCSADMQMR